jgi:transposase InsO family protein
VAIKALACELPSQHGLPLSRLSLADISREAVRRGLVATIGDTTLWRWLSEDAIRPWTHRSWIFPRDPDFRDKAGRILECELLARTTLRTQAEARIAVFSFIEAWYNPHRRHSALG